MEITVRGKHFEVPEQVAERARRKLERLDHYLPALRNANVEVDLAQEKSKEPGRRFVVHVSVNGNGVRLRAEERASQPETAIDQAARVLTEQARRHKQRLYERGRGGAAKEIAAEPSAVSSEGEDSADGILAKVARVERVSIKPMTIEEAIEQIELLKADYFLFLEGDTQRFALLYRQDEGDFVLILPELS